MFLSKLKPRKKEDAAAADQVYVASQWQLIWWKFRKHKLAMACTVIVALIYLAALFVEFLAPYEPSAQNKNATYHPPTPIHFVDNEGHFSLRPFIYGYNGERDPLTFTPVYTVDYSKKYPLRFFAKGAEYRLWGLIPGNLHLFGLDVDPEERMVYLIGTDQHGQDLFSRMVYGTRISMSVGLVGVLMSFFFGVFFGGISGYFGGWVDTLIQRFIEIIKSMPTIPLWMILSAALPTTWGPVKMYFAITIIISLIGWTSLARVVRGRFLALREEDFIMAARVSGASQMRIIFRHMVPSFYSHIIAALTLAIPEMILSETSLSFLGLGLRYPAISWGVLLQDAQNLNTVANAPWLLIPGIAVVVAVLSLNFVGDGLRDAADPYSA